LLARECWQSLCYDCLECCVHHSSHPVFSSHHIAFAASISRWYRRLTLQS
jgi:uncharacterized cysteine cluster protein YcgN (CxxCxxCC family)